MTTAIQFKPLYGAHASEPLCFLLEVDESTFLLDAGWTTQFDPSLLEPLRPLVNRIDAVLISHPDVMHLGALPYLVGKLGLACPIYATIPVYKMGQMFMYDAYQARSNSEDFTIFDLDDVDAAFEKFVQLKFQQRVALTGKCTGIEISARPAGHQIGGSVWLIKKDVEEIVYAVDFNHSTERHLGGTALETLSKPTLLIVDSLNAIYAPLGRKKRESELLEQVTKTLGEGGDVLMPVDSGGRVLEIAMVLDSHWTQNKIQHPVVFLTNVAFNTIEFAKSQLEWMSESVMHTFENSRENPFSFRNIRLIHSIEELDGLRLPSPKLVLASMPDLEAGFSRILFAQYASNPKNLVVLTDRGIPGTLSHKLLEKEHPGSVDLILKERVPLEGEELQEYRTRKEEERNQKNGDGMILDSESDEESDEDFQSKVAFQSGFDMTSDQFLKAGFKHAMFPFVERIQIFDEYGEAIIPADFELVDKLHHNEREGEKPDQMEVDLEPEEENPTKCIVQEKHVDIKCHVVFIDFEGRSDGRSLKTILQHVAPRKLIIVHGTKESTENLKHYCQTNKELKNTCKMVLSPANGEGTAVTSDTIIWKVKLKEDLIASLRSHTIGDYQLAAVKAIVQGDPGLTGGLSMLEACPIDDAPPHKFSMIGELKLYDMRSTLVQAGFSADLRHGVLVVNSSDGTLFSIRKTEVGGRNQFKLEGVMTEDYFKIRALLYSQFTTL